MPNVNNVKSAWVVMWEWCGNHAKKDKKIISFFNYRTGEKQIKDFVERAYASSEYTLQEHLNYLKYPKNNPYRVKSDVGLITCGHNPWICARFVKNLRLVDNNLIWDEIDRESIRKSIKRINLPKTL